MIDPSSSEEESDEETIEDNHHAESASFNTSASPGIGLSSSVQSGHPTASSWGGASSLDVPVSAATLPRCRK